MSRIRLKIKFDFFLLIYTIINSSKIWRLLVHGRNRVQYIANRWRWSSNLPLSVIVAVFGQLRCLSASRQYGFGCRYVWISGVPWYRTALSVASVRVLFRERKKDEVCGLRLEDASSGIDRADRKRVTRNKYELEQSCGGMSRSRCSCHARGCSPLFTITTHPGTPR